MAPGKRCQVVADTVGGVLSCELELPLTASIDVALSAARACWPQAPIDWPQVSVGVFGRVRTRDYVPQEGERIELYRGLPHDPRAARRQRAARSRR